MCRISPEEYHALEKTLRTIAVLAARAGLKTVEEQARELLEDLHIFRPSDRICYEEFYYRVKTLVSLLGPAAGRL